MMITLTIYIFIIGYIIFKAFYFSIKPFNNSTNTIIFQDSISLSALPFYINQGKINLFAFFINFLLLSFISLTLLPDLISNHVVYCMDWNNESKLVGNMIENTYEISNEKRSYIYHLNYKHIGIKDYEKVFQGFSQDFNDILNKQNILFKDEQFNNLLNNKNIHMKMYNKSHDILSLSANAYKNILFSFKNSNFPINYLDNSLTLELFNKILNNNNIDVVFINENVGSFVGDYQINNLNIFNIEALKFFNSLENTKEIAKKNMFSELKIIPEDEKIIIKNLYELENYCDKKLILTLEKELNKGRIYTDIIIDPSVGVYKSFDIHMDINNKHKQNFLYENQDKMGIIINKDFFLKKQLQINYNPFNRLTNHYYNLFNSDFMNKHMLEKYNRYIEEIIWREEESNKFQREVEEEDGF